MTVDTQMDTLPYARHHVTEDDIAVVVEVLRGPELTQGHTVQAFERELARYTGAKYAVAVSSGTAALHLAYLASGKYRLMTSPLTFVATANAALLCGMDVRFWDVDEATGNANLPGYKDCLSVPVHYAGRAAPLPKTGTVIEDACHALGAMDYDGCSRVGSCAHSLATAFSFHPAKAITTGEGGAITTNDALFAGSLKLLRSHGRVNSHGQGEMVALGLNYRMSDINAALGLSQLKRLDTNVERRFQLARLYTMAFDGWSQEVNGTIAPGHVSPRGSAWHLFVIRIGEGRRDEVKAKLAERGIVAQVHYPLVTQQPYYRALYPDQERLYPNAERWAAETLSLPLFPEMRDEDVTRVVDALKEALN